MMTQRFETPILNLASLILISYKLKLDKNLSDYSLGGEKSFRDLQGYFIICGFLLVRLTNLPYMSISISVLTLRQ